MLSRWKVVMLLLSKFSEVQPQTKPECEECKNVFSIPGTDDGALVGNYRYILGSLLKASSKSTLLPITVL
jgi:hypothetical protein